MRACAEIGKYFSQGMATSGVGISIRSQIMFRLNDVKKLKKDELISLAESKNIVINVKSTKANIINLLVDNGCVNKAESLPELSASLPSIALSFNSDELRYEQLDAASLDLLPNVNFYDIYKHCCQDSTSFKALDRASKHRAAGDITNIKLCQVCFLLLLVISSFKSS